MAKAEKQGEKKEPKKRKRVASGPCWKTMIMREFDAANAELGMLEDEVLKLQGQLGRTP